MFYYCLCYVMKFMKIGNVYLECVKVTNKRFVFKSLECNKKIENII